MEITLTTLVIVREWFLALTSLQLGVFAGVLQAVGYTFYIRKTLKNEIEPNPATWLMFAYGVGLLTILHFDAGASPALLFLPVTCAVLAIYVAYLCWHRGTLGWPEDWEDRAAFVADLTLTCGYVLAWSMVLNGNITEDSRALITILMIWITNATTVTAFTPLLRGAYSNPHREHPIAWIIWTCAYATLAWATYKEGSGDYPSTLSLSGFGYQTAISFDVLFVSIMVYPVLNAILHGAVAVLSRKTRKVRYLRELSVAGE